MWIFGYGSLIWKVDFIYEKRIAGYIEGYSRKFWQGSEDHRGVPGKPGRVVTLVPSENRVWGMAYKIPDNKVKEVSAHLAFREKGGYEERTVIFRPRDLTTDPFSLQIYIGSTTNPYFLGPASLHDIAKQISVSHGPSGPNSEYLLKLAESVRTVIPEDKDPDLFELERLVIAQLGQTTATK